MVRDTLHVTCHILYMAWHMLCSMRGLLRIELNRFASHRITSCHVLWYLTCLTACHDIWYHTTGCRNALYCTTLCNTVLHLCFARHNSNISHEHYASWYCVATCCIPFDYIYTTVWRQLISNDVLSHLVAFPGRMQHYAMLYYTIVHGLGTYGVIQFGRVPDSIIECGILS